MSRGATVVAIAGLPGAGKTTLAERLCSATGWQRISRDLIRAALFVPCSFSAEERDVAFRVCGSALEANLALGRSCVVEGMPFSRVGELEEIERVAQGAGARFVAVVVDVDVDTAMERVAAHTVGGVGRWDARDRTPSLVADVARRMRSFGPEVHVLDGRRSPDALAATLLGVVGEADP